MLLGEMFVLWERFGEAQVCVGYSFGWAMLTPCCRHFDVVRLGLAVQEVGTMRLFGRFGRILDFESGPFLRQSPFIRRTFAALSRGHASRTSISHHLQPHAKPSSHLTSASIHTRSSFNVRLSILIVTAQRWVRNKARGSKVQLAGLC